MRRRRPRSAEGRILERIARKHIPDNLDLWPAIAARVQPERERAGHWSWFPRGPLLEAAVISVIVVAIVSGIVVWGQWGAAPSVDAPATEPGLVVDATTTGSMPVGIAGAPLDSPPMPTSVGMPEARCRYQGPQYNGYLCDFSGRFYVTVTGCDALSTNVDWGDGNVIEADALPVGERIEHQYTKPGMYYVKMDAQYDASTCSTPFATSQFVFEYPGGQVTGTAGIAFQSDRDGNFEIYVMNADGSQQINLTNASGADISPAWSPDGRQIAFASDRSGSHEIFVMDANGTNVVQLTDSPGRDMNPTWSPDGSRLAFTSDRDGNFEIYTMDINGGSLQRITDTASSEQNPAWSPDGTRIAHVSDRAAIGQGFDIWLMNADGSDPRQLTSAPESEVSPAWSPDGERIAYGIERRDGQTIVGYEIHVVGADGSDPHLLEGSLTADAAPAWSPNSEFIAFQSFRDGNWNIYLMRADGTGQTPLTTTVAADMLPSWSPSTAVSDDTSPSLVTPESAPSPPPPIATPSAAAGTAEPAILFASHRGDVHDSQIYVMGVDGSNARPLTLTRGHTWRPRVAPDGARFFFTSVAPGEHAIHDATGGGITGTGNHDTFVATFTGSTTADLAAAEVTNITAGLTAWDSAWSWSPDGSLIAFTSDRSGNWDIYTMTPDGQNVTQITTDGANDGWPAWTPDGTQILFSSDRTGNWEIWSMARDGSDVRPLTDRPDTADLFPEVSPDGTRVVFSSQEAAGNTGEIYIMDLSGEQVVRLTSTAALNTMPSWCPGGDTMVFVSDRAGNDDIYLMNADGSNVVALTDDPGEDTTPQCAMIAAPAP